MTPDRIEMFWSFVTDITRSTTMKAAQERNLPAPPSHRDAMISGVQAAMRDGFAVSSNAHRTIRSDSASEAGHGI
jgi:hypothetical protein